MRTPALSPASDAPRSAPNGSQVTITLIDGDGSELVLSGTITNQPTNRRLGILLNDGRFYFGRANLYSRDHYRLLIGDRIKIVPADQVELILIQP